MTFLTEIPVIQAPMAGSQGSALAIAVSNAGGLGSLPCALLTPQAIRAELSAITEATAKPYNVDFFVHREPAVDDGIGWRTDDDADRWRRLRDRLAAHGVPVEYGDAVTVGERVVAILARRPLLALSAVDAGRVADWLAEALPAVHAAAPALLAEVRAAME